MTLAVETDVVVEVPLPAGVTPAEIERLVPFVLRREGAKGEWAIAVVLTDNAHLQALHREFMGIDTPTDVMSFPVSEEPTGPERGGDVVVSVQRAIEQAPEFGTTPAEEVRFLVVHGLLHLLGWLDGTEAERSAMHLRQSELLRAFRAAGSAS